MAEDHLVTRLGRIFIAAALPLLLTSAQRPAFADPNACVQQQQTTCLSAAERAVIELFERAAPSVVQITALSGLNDKARFVVSLGSGFFWDASGHIVTNEHVVRGAESVSILLTSGKQFDTEIVGRAPNYDVAVLRLKQAQGPVLPIERGRSDNLKVGQFVYTIGNPLGLDQSLTTGVISALRRQLPTGHGRQITNVIQTSAATFPGDSGGPLLDSAGRLIGVNTIAYLTGQPPVSIGFAIPVDVVNRIVPELIRVGRVPTAGIGIIPGRGHDGGYVDGIVVVQITPGSPAERAGLLGADASTGTTGDVITHANGQPIRSIYDLTALLEHVGIGQRIQLGIERNGSRLQIEVDIIDIDDGPAVSALETKP